jgi:hypothetical protein
MRLPKPRRIATFYLEQEVFLGVCRQTWSACHPQFRLLLSCQEPHEGKALRKLGFEDFSLMRMSEAPPLGEALCYLDIGMFLCSLHQFDGTFHLSWTIQIGLRSVNPAWIFLISLRNHYFRSMIHLLG